MPLRVQIWSRKNTSTPAFEVGFTSLSMKPPSASTFAFTTPPSATTESSPLSGPHSVNSRPAAHQTDATKVLGRGWTSVFVDQLSDATPALAQQQSAPAAGSSPAKRVVRGPGYGGNLGQILDEFATPVDGGHLIATSLLSVFIKDNRVLVGAVSPQYLEHLAASMAGR
jgi:hypothetical protein